MYTTHTHTYPHIHTHSYTHTHTHTHTQSSPVHSPAHHPAPPSEPAATERGGASADAAWKEAFEKLRKDFEKFKEDCKRDMQILTDDLDKERKARAMLEVDIDRLKKTRDLR